MALYERKEFCELCGIEAAYLTVNIGRKKVILTDNKIDDSKPENALFLKKRLDTLAAKGTSSPDKGAKKEGDSKNLKAVKGPDKPLDPAAQKAWDLGLEQKALAIEKTKEEIELKKMQRQKMLGELMPTDLVKVVFATHSKSITASFKEGVENILTTVAKQTGLDRPQIAKIRGDLIGIINKSVKDAGEISRKRIKNIVVEYTNSRGVGESK